MQPLTNKSPKPECSCCGDPATKPVGDRVYCVDCYNELFEGIIDPTPAKLGVGRGE